MDEPQFKFDKKQNSIIITVKTDLYPLSSIYGAAYIFLDRCYIFLDRNSESEVLVELTPKNPEDLELLARDFFDELLNYSFYESQSRKNLELKNTLLRAAFFANLCLEDKGLEKYEDIEGDS